MRIVAPIPHYGGARIPKNKNHPKRKISKNVQKYAKISDTPFDQMSLIHREARFPGGPRIPKNPFFFKGKKSSKTQKLKNVQRYAKISDTPFDQRSLIHWEAWFLGGPKIPQNQIFLKHGKNHLKRKNSKTSRNMLKLVIRPLTRGL